MMKLSRNIDRFWAKVDKTETCWNWTGAKTKAGYGQFYHQESGKGVVYYTHRLSYELVHGEIAKGMHVDHRCHNVACLRPDHLRAVTASQNGENRRGPSSDNKSSGIRGVTWDKARNLWKAQAGKNGKNYQGGRFKTIEEAEAAAISLRNRLYSCNDLDRAA